MEIFFISKQKIPSVLAYLQKNAIFYVNIIKPLNHGWYILILIKLIVKQI